VTCFFNREVGRFGRFSRLWRWRAAILFSGKVASPVKVACCDSIFGFYCESLLRYGRLFVMKEWSRKWGYIFVGFKIWSSWTASTRLHPNSLTMPSPPAPEIYIIPHSRDLHFHPLHRFALFVVVWKKRNGVGRGNSTVYRECSTSITTKSDASKTLPIFLSIHRKC